MTNIIVAVYIRIYALLHRGVSQMRVLVYLKLLHEIGDFFHVVADLNPEVLQLGLFSAGGDMAESKAQLKKHKKKYIYIYWER